MLAAIGEGLRPSRRDLISCNVNTTLKKQDVYDETLHKRENPSLHRQKNARRSRSDDHPKRNISNYIHSLADDDRSYSAIARGILY